MNAALRSAFKWCVVVLVLVTAPVSIPLLILGFLTETIFAPGEWAFKWRMRQKQRVLSKRELLKRLQSCRGTLLLDSPTFSWAITRLWWTEDDVLSLAPVRPPDERGLEIGKQPFRWHPFDRWVWEKFLDREQGRALLVGVWHSEGMASSLIRRQADVQLVRSWSGGQYLEKLESGSAA